MLIGTPANIFRYTDELGQFFYFKFALEFKNYKSFKKTWNSCSLQKCTPIDKKKLGDYLKIMWTNM